MGKKRSSVSLCTTASAISDRYLKPVEPLASNAFLICKGEFLWTAVFLFKLADGLCGDVHLAEGILEFRSYFTSGFEFLSKKSIIAGNVEATTLIWSPSGTSK